MSITPQRTTTRDRSISYCALTSLFGTAAATYELSPDWQAHRCSREPYVVPEAWAEPAKERMALSKYEEVPPRMFDDMLSSQM